MDLLTEAEEEVDLRTGHLRFDIELLAGRLLEATDWLQREPATRGLAVGYFGASTGAAAALVAAAAKPRVVRAIVSRGGRPDLAGEALWHVQAPTLLIVGGNDRVVIDLNREALAQLHIESKMEIVPGATHLFEERGALEKVAALARGWFERYLKQTDQLARISQHEKATNHYARSAKK
jgi:dienelactone hydrolase